MPAGSNFLHPGEQLGFGGQDPAWVLSTDSPPGAVAVSGEVEVHAKGGWITLPPGDESPEISVYGDHAGRWVVGKAGEIEPAPDQVVVAGRVWVLELPVAVVSTFQTSPAGIEASRLRFFVSADEETTHVVVVTGEIERRLADRTHHYLLLTLARQRLEHRQEGYSSEEEGWIHREDLADALRMELGAGPGRRGSRGRRAPPQGR